MMQAQPDLIQQSAWFTPSVIVTAAIAIIGFVAWLIRLESRLNGVEKTVTKQETSIEEGWKDFDQHRQNAGIHFDQRLASEVERRQMDRMERMQADINEIKQIVKGMAR